MDGRVVLEKFDNVTALTNSLKSGKSFFEELLWKLLKKLFINLVLANKTKSHINIM